MNTAPRDACQSTSDRPHRRLVIWAAGGMLTVAVAGGILLYSRSLPPAAPVAAALTPPGATAPLRWRQDLDAALLLEAALASTPAADAAEMAQRELKLAEVYRQLAVTYPTHVAVQKAAGEQAWRHDRPFEAIPLLTRAQALDPMDADTADTLASAEVALGQTRDAAAELQKAARLAPDEPRYHFALANVLYLFRHDLVAPPELPDEAAVLDRALAEFRRAAELAPADLRYAQAYAETFYILPQPDWEQARTAWKAVLSLSGSSTDFANGHLARVSLRMKQPVQTEGYLALMHDPHFAVLKANLQNQAANLTPAPAGSPPAY